MKTQTKLHVSLAILFQLIAFGLMAQSYGEIRGVIKNTESQAVPFATIKILQGRLLVGGALTNEEGIYSCKPLNPGTYEMVILQTEYKTQLVQNITVKPNEATYFNCMLSVNSLTTIEVFAEPILYTPVGVEATMFHQVSISGTELNQTAGYNRGDASGALEFITADVVADKDGGIHFRGSRDGASGFFVDGVRTMNAANVPGLSIENLSVFSGGVPAMYGDLSGGVVIITTKSYFSGIREKNIRVAAMKERRAAEKAEQEK